MLPRKVLSFDLPEPSVLPTVSRVILHDADEPARLKPRKLDDYDLNFILEGEPVFDVDGEAQRVRAGEVIFGFPGSVYGFHAERRARVRFYHCHVTFGKYRHRFIEGRLDAWARMASRLDAAAAKTSRTLYLPDRMRLMDAAGIAEEFSLTKKEQRRNNAGSALAAEARFLMLLQVISGQVLKRCGRFAGDTQLNRTQKHVTRALEFIDGRLDRLIALNEVSDHLRINPEYLARIFKTQTGQSVGQYILRRKMEQARERLLSTRLSVKEVAASLGYRDPLYFSRVFRKTEGRSPADYRSRHL